MDIFLHLMLVSKFFTIYFLDLSTVHHCIIHLNVYALQEQGLITMTQLLACLSCSYSHHRQTIRNLLLSLSPMNPPVSQTCSSIQTSNLDWSLCRMRILFSHLLAQSSEAVPLPQYHTAVWILVDLDLKSVLS
jgi:hypothetical protein